MFRNDLTFVRSHYTPTTELKRIELLETALEELKRLRDSHDLNLENEIKELEERIKQLSEIEPQEEIPYPDWLSLEPVFIPKIRLDAKDGVQVVRLNPLDPYTSSYAVKELAKRHNLKTLYKEDKKACAYAIWKIVIGALTYEYDKEEDWRPSYVTIRYTHGDCEDGTILFVDLAREAGFRPDEVFNACGWVSTTSGKFGHSFPILNYGEGWNIYESTLDRVPTAPMPFKGSNYSADWGLTNWEWFGKIKDTLQI